MGGEVGVDNKQMHNYNECMSGCGNQTKIKQQRDDEGAHLQFLVVKEGLFDPHPRICLLI